jgi:hypothetical protein
MRRAARYQWQHEILAGDQVFGETLPVHHAYHKHRVSRSRRISILFRDPLDYDDKLSHGLHYLIAS